MPPLLTVTGAVTVPVPPSVPATATEPLVNVPAVTDSVTPLLTVVWPATFRL